MAKKKATEPAGKLARSASRVLRTVGEVLSEGLSFAERTAGDLLAGRDRGHASSSPSTGGVEPKRSRRAAASSPGARTKRKAAAMKTVGAARKSAAPKSTKTKTSAAKKAAPTKKSSKKG
jgi:hypothetical protein